MTDRTSQKPFYTVVIGKKVIFMARPQLTRQKKYREPVVAKVKKFPTRDLAEIAARQWEGFLV